MQATSLSFTRSLQTSSLLTKAVAVLAGSLFIAAAAQVDVPMFPVPMTMTTFAVLAVGLLYGARLGALTVIAYIAEGALGLPVFAGGANMIMLLAKPFTAGYIVGFVGAAAVAGWFAERRAGIGPAVIGVLAGTVVIYALGVAWLAIMLGDLGAAFAGGMIPFLLGDALKAVLAIAVREGLGRVDFGRR